MYPILSTVTMRNQELTVHTRYLIISSTNQQQRSHCFFHRGHRKEDKKNPVVYNVPTYYPTSHYERQWRRKTRICETHNWQYFELPSQATDRPLDLSKAFLTAERHASCFNRFYVYLLYALCNFLWLFFATTCGYYVLWVLVIIIVVLVTNSIIILDTRGLFCILCCWFNYYAPGSNVCKWEWIVTIWGIV